MKSKDFDKFFYTLIESNFCITKTLETLNYTLNDFHELCLNDDFYDRLKTTSRTRKTLVEMELFKRCMEKADAAAIKEFFRLMKENEAGENDNSSYVVEFFEKIDDE
jgi:hypothetical protein